MNKKEFEFPPEPYLHKARPYYLKKSFQLREKRKRRKDLRIMLAGYALFLLAASAFVLEYAIHGLTTSLSIILMLPVFMAITSLCCIPWFFRRIRGEFHE